MRPLMLRINFTDSHSNTPHSARSSRGHQPGESHFEPLEPRQMLSFTGLSDDLLSTFNLTTTASTAALTLPAGSGVFSPSNTSAGAATASARSLLRLDAFNNDPRFRGFTGRGVSTVVLDTGIDLDHPAFGPDANRDRVADRIVYQYDFADNDADASDRGGHGSNVAGIIGSSDSLYHGVAPDVNLIALKVFRDNGSGTFAAIERALQWVVANAARHNIVSVNMSLGDMGNYQANQALYGISDELAALAARNVIVVSAAGNSFFEFGSAPGLAYPAADRNSLAVGATYATTGGGWTYAGGARADATAAGAITPFSQRSTALQSVFAPGAPITGPNAIGGWGAMHGTSQAAPQVTGVVTLAQQLAMAALGRRLSLPEFRTLLTTTGRTILDGDDERDNVANTGQTFRAVDMLALGNAIYNLAVPQPPVNAPLPTPAPQPPVQPAANRAPTLSSVATLAAGVAGRPVTITYNQLAAAANEADPDGDRVNFRITSVAAGTLFKGARVVVPGQTTLGPGESLMWVPPTNSTGLRTAFSVTANDGRLDSGTPVGVQVRFPGANLPGVRDVLAVADAALPAIPMRAATFLVFSTPAQPAALSEPFVAADGDVRSAASLMAA